MPMPSTLSAPAWSAYANSNVSVSKYFSIFFRQQAMNISHYSKMISPCSLANSSLWQLQISGAFFQGLGLLFNSQHSHLSRWAWEIPEILLSKTADITSLRECSSRSLQGCWAMQCVVELWSLWCASPSPVFQQQKGKVGGNERGNTCGFKDGGNWEEGRKEQGRKEGRECWCQKLSSTSLLLMGYWQQ